MRKGLRHMLGGLALILLGQAASAQATVQDMDFRIVLAQLAQKVGANGQITILRAQGDAPAPAIVLRGGTMDLAEVAAQTGDALTRDAAGRFVLTRPLLVWDDATLRLGAQDDLYLDAGSGAFLAALGGLVVEGGKVTSAPLPTDTAELEDTFHPFILVAGQGHIAASGADFSNLGFGKIPAFSGVALINRGIFPARETSHITKSTISHVQALSLLSVDDAVLTGNRISNAQETGVVIRAGQRIRIADTVVDAPGGHGVRIAEGAQGVRITGTDIRGPKRNGILVDSRSTDIALVGNSVTAPQSTGILIDGAFCVRAEGNVIADGAYSGIAVQRSAHVALAANTLARNHSAGIAVSEQPPAGATLLSGNRLVGNRVGIRGVTSGDIQFVGNDFSDQFPRFLDGDLMFETRRVARDLRGAEPFDFAGAHDTRAIVVPDCTTPGGA